MYASGAPQWWAEGVVERPAAASIQVSLIFTGGAGQYCQDRLRMIVYDF